ncbi:MAG: hypothetical protein VKP70_02080 [Cyanobacteriota bacterium]|nr:hypothetical protein [Cyanobacteriota bacterium]
MQAAKPFHQEPPLSERQVGPRMGTAPPTMAFKNEKVSDADIDRYKLPFKKGDRRWWTRDAERDYYLWGGLCGNPAFEREQEGWFYLYVDEVIYWIKMYPDTFSPDLKTDPYLVNWRAVLRIEPNPRTSRKRERLIRILKEALMAYGLTGENDYWPKNWLVSFDF